MDSERLVYPGWFLLQIALRYRGWSRLFCRPGSAAIGRRAQLSVYQQYSRSEPDDSLRSEEESGFVCGLLAHQGHGRRAVRGASGRRRSADAAAGLRPDFPAGLPVTPGARFRATEPESKVERGLAILQLSRDLRPALVLSE